MLNMNKLFLWVSA